jgi:hypothetical protein
MQLEQKCWIDNLVPLHQLPRTVSSSSPSHRYYQQHSQLLMTITTANNSPPKQKTTKKTLYTNRRPSTFCTHLQSLHHTLQTVSRAYSHHGTEMYVRSYCEMQFKRVHLFMESVLLLDVVAILTLVLLPMCFHLAFCLSCPTNLLPSHCSPKCCTPLPSIDKMVSNSEVSLRW